MLFKVYKTQRVGSVRMMLKGFGVTKWSNGRTATLSTVENTVSELKRVMNWMLQEIPLNGAHRLSARAVVQFPSIFAHPNRNANLRKPNRWLHDTESYLDRLKNMGRNRLSITTRRDAGDALRTVRFKALPGRGRKIPQWKTYSNIWLMSFVDFCPLVLKWPDYWYKTWLWVRTLLKTTMSATSSLTSIMGTAWSLQVQKA